MKRAHSMPFGAELSEDGTVRFRLWAPKAKRVELCLESPATEQYPLTQLDDGWFELVTPAARAGTRYRFLIDGDIKVPDPASRFQPLDVHGPSEVIDPRSFDWNDEHWRGRSWEEVVIYELHVGTFTPEGTFQAVEKRLDYLRDLGVTAIELMPIADFPGRRNWGYDGVLLYAPDSCYGRPEDLKRLVQAAHERGLVVFLDVVYNHFGPDGNYLSVYSPQFFTNRHHTPWGDAINFDGPESRVVRDFFIHNALYWLEEYHLDGLRLDAVHAIADDSRPDIITELAEVVRQRINGERVVHLMLENADNAAHYLGRDHEGRVTLYDAQWNDDIHHALHVLITGEHDGYYSDYAHEPLRHLCRCLSEGFAYQGEHSEFHGAQRGEPSRALPPSAFISFLQNHDQVGNRAFGERIVQLAPGAALRAAMEILLLAPSPPLLFMGEEFGAATPFLFFCDFRGELASAVTNGRRNEFARFAKFSSMDTREKIPNPNAEETYHESKLDWTSLGREPHSTWLKLYKNLLSIRQRKVVPHFRGLAKASAGRCSDEKLILSIDWTLSDNTLLQLRANLGSAPSSTAGLHSGDEIYSSNPAACRGLGEGNLPPWSVVWLLSESGP
jgi:maltooligosyltrehalose trehalohydrolase